MNRSLLLIALLAATLGACAAQDEPLDPSEHTSTHDAQARFVAGVLAPAPGVELADIKTPPSAIQAAECGIKGVPVLVGVEGYWDEAGQVGVVIRGQSCLAEISSFDFNILDPEGNDVSGRSWPEVDEIHMEEDGSFTLRGVAASCSDVSRGVRVRVMIRLDNGVVSEAVEAEIR